MSATAAIQIEGLCKTYRQRNGQPIHAVSQVSLAVPQGQLLGFLGPNGAGKTTTLKMLCALVRPTAGWVRVNGHDAWRERAAAMRQIGVVLEGTRNVHWSLSAWDNLIYFGHLKGLWGQALAGRAERLLRELALWERRGDLVRTYSRGMQQKVAIACALVSDPPIVLLDEPTLGLDVQAARTVRELVARLVSEQGKTVVLTTHQLDMAQALCERVVIISKGRVIADQGVDELIGLFREQHYRIEVAGRLPEPLGPAIQGLSVHEEEGHTILTGPLADQEALHDLLSRFHRLHLPLVSVVPVEPNLEQVFVHMLDREDAAEVGR